MQEMQHQWQAEQDKRPATGAQLGMVVDWCEKHLGLGKNIEMHRPLRHYFLGWAGEGEYVEVQVSSEFLYGHLAYFLTRRAKEFEKSMAGWVATTPKLKKLENRRGCLTNLMEGGANPFEEDWRDWL